MNFVGINKGSVVRVILETDVSIVGYLLDMNEDSVLIGPYDNRILGGILEDASLATKFKDAQITNWSVSWPTCIVNKFIKEIIILIYGKVESSTSVESKETA